MYLDNSGQQLRTVGAEPLNLVTSSQQHQPLNLATTHTSLHEQATVSVVLFVLLFWKRTAALSQNNEDSALADKQLFCSIHPPPSALFSSCCFHCGLLKLFCGYLSLSKNWLLGGTASGSRVCKSHCRGGSPLAPDGQKYDSSAMQFWVTCNFAVQRTLLQPGQDWPFVRIPLPLSIESCRFDSRVRVSSCWTTQKGQLAPEVAFLPPLRFLPAFRKSSLSGSVAFVFRFIVVTSWGRACGDVNIKSWNNAKNNKKFASSLLSLAVATPLVNLLWCGYFVFSVFCCLWCEFDFWWFTFRCNSKVNNRVLTHNNNKRR